MFCLDVGCFALSKAKDLLSGAQKLSRELAIRTAPRKSPSSSFAETRAARESRSERLCAVKGGTGTSSSSATARLFSAARSLLWPPLLGAWRHRRGNIRKDVPMIHVSCMRLCRPKLPITSLLFDVVKHAVFSRSLFPLKGPD